MYVCMYVPGYMSDTVNIHVVFLFISLTNHVYIENPPIYASWTNVKVDHFPLSQIKMVISVFGQKRAHHPIYLAPFHGSERTCSVVLLQFLFVFVLLPHVHHNNPMLSS